MVAGGRADDRRAPGGRRQRRGARAAAGHRRGARALAGAPDGHLRARARRCSTSASGSPAARPAPLRDLPALPGDELDRERSGGDLCVQACADDPQVAFHAVRNLARIGRGAVTVRWSQLGFGRTSSTSRAQETPRNLMGFKDGTANIKAEDADALARHVWVAGDRRSEPAWLRGGTYLVARRIRMLHRGLGPRVAGRPGADDRPPQGLRRAAGRRATSSTTLKVDRLPADSHVRLAAPSSNDGAALLRRGYSFTDGARRPPRPARRRALLPLLPARPGARSSASSAGSAPPTPQRVHQARRLGRVGRSRPASGVAATSVRGSSPPSRRAAGLGARARPAGAPPSRQAAGLGGRARPAGAGRARGRRRPRGAPPRHVTARRRRREGHGRGCAPPRGAS